MVGCFGRAAHPSPTIRLDLDNELEDAQWFSRDQLAVLVGSEKGSYLSKSDLKLLDRASGGTAAKAENDKVTAGALAPSENKEGGKTVRVDEEEGKMKLTRVPPATAIAGTLIRTWVAGGVDLVSKL